MTDNAETRWDRHWDDYAKATRSNPGHALRRRLVIRLLGPDADKNSAAILDIGCGSGELLLELSQRFSGAAFAGIDQSRSGLDAAAEKLPKAKLVHFDFTEGTAPDELRGWATHAVCSEVLEHVDDPVKLLEHAGQCLKPGGRLAVTVPGGPVSAFDRHLGHQEHFTKARLKEILEKAGFEVEQTAAAGFPVFNLYRLAVILRGEKLIDDVSGETGFLAGIVMAVFRGLMGLTFLDSPWGWQIVATARKPE
ncbi:MAG: class I SAM-dependent methyltransferase [Rhodospirillales bacterium]|nr:class I SAM-dependent methyltransferase [Rhodospirillales bacterium]